MLQLKDFMFFRYLGAEKLSSNGVEVNPRDVVGIMTINEGLAYIISPKYPTVATIDRDMAETIIASSRKFVADPAPLFANISLKGAESIAVPKVDLTKDQPKTPVDSKPAPDPELDDATRWRKEAAERVLNKDSVDYGDLKPLEYARPIYTGGTTGNYQVAKLPKCGAVKLDVMPASQLMASMPTLKSVYTERNQISAIDLPDYVMQDIMHNVMPAIGLNVKLPFKRLYIGQVDANITDGAHLTTYRVHGVLHGAIALDPRQMIRLMGGYNSRAVAHIITHEVAHFIDNTMVKNLDRIRFTESIRGKNIHPDTTRAGAIKSVPAEHFATLAELMVWGDSVRKVYALNGVETVMKYFENRYIPAEDIEKRKV